MKKYLYFIVAAIALFIIPSCNKVSHNGALDGQWQIMTIENLNTGEIISPEKGEYICINLHVLQLRRGGVISANMAYDKKAGIIDAQFPYVASENVSSQLGPFGIFSNPVRMNIVKLNHKELILKTDATLITCRKF